MTDAPTAPLPDDLAAVRGEEITQTTIAPSVGVTVGWDLRAEARAWRAAAESGRPHLSVRLLGEQVTVGPLWVPGTDSGCAGCAEARLRIIDDHPLLEEPAVPSRVPGAESPLLAELLLGALSMLRAAPLGPGELYRCGAGTAGRHRVPRSSGCPVCRPTVPSVDPARPPARWAPVSRPAVPGNPARSAAGAALVRGRGLRDRVVDPAFGPVLGTIRDVHAPFAMSSAVNPDAKAWGYGRSRTFAEAEPVALLEVYERLSGFPHDAPVLVGRSPAELADRAVNPAELGGYTPEQLTHPLSRVLPSDRNTPMDWVWAHWLHGGEPVLVPAEVGFYQYGYQYRRYRHRLRHDPRALRRQHYHPESSSGCALGANLEEATLHSLFELAERDAFLVAFHRAHPLPVIDPASLDDPVSALLLDSIRSRGFEPHLLVITGDIALPAVWALAVNRGGGYPASWSAAGSGIDPVGAVRAALWELAQLVREPPEFDRSHAESLLEDAFRVDVLEDHMALYALPERLARITAVLGGPTLRLDDAFGEAASAFREAAGDDVRGALEYTSELFAAAGLDRIAVVDQTTREHRDLNLAAAKAVVPGIVPLTFGHCQQRLVGLARLDRALAEAGRPGEDRPAAPYDPHPFP
ncbi:TOMM precursor leader peptide-binding protein [Streptomyces sp. NPDC058299]|uniref:TOMM precursor leader peptide-binding protein n=1 Tax=unclassified Streptomyces TaxID=2593676 RepID=UPI0036EBA462